MPKILLKRWLGMHLVWMVLFVPLLIIILFWYEWMIALVALLAAIILGYYTVRANQKFQSDLSDYVGTLSHRIKRAGNDVINEMPIGMVLYSEDKTVEWHNPYAAQILGLETLHGESILELYPKLKSRKEKELKLEIEAESRLYELQIKPEERLLFFTDITEFTLLHRKYEEEKLVVGLVMMDNLDEVTQGMDDQSRSILMAKITGQITEWANKYQLFLKRTSSDRYLFMMNQTGLKALEQSRFEILDDVRDMTIEHKLPLTLSIGVASGSTSLNVLGQWAQTGLDMALGRGGDQAAVKIGEKLTFYGGRSNAVEKRTRVRARVISHALRDLMRESDKVIIMGHRNPDMDSIGAAIGVLKMAHISNKEGYIVLEGVNPSIAKLMESLEEDENLNRWFITPEQALQIMNNRALAVVVDTHRASMVAEPKLLQLTHRKFVIDHHRRSEEFIQDATLVYMEPYASSTCELVTELLQYFHERLTMEPLEATVLLAGIVVDTKSFSLQTGARTFEAASFLRRNGADSSQVQQLLKEDLESYIQKAEIIKNVVVIHDHIALAVTEPGRKYSQLIIAQVADTLLTMTGILASFVISERPDGMTGISARSMGQMNVQVVMERLNGGGHLTNAATQLECTPKEAAAQLEELLSKIEAEEGLFE